MKIIYFLFIFVLWTHVSYAQPNEKKHQDQRNQTANAERPTQPATQAINEPNTKRQAAQEQSDAEDHAFRTQQAKQNETIAESTRLIMIFSAVSALVAGIYAFFSFGQWRAMQKSLEQAEQSMKYGQAAYLVVEAVRFGGAPHLGGRIEVTLNVLNAGNTPAYDVQTWSHITYETKDFAFTHEEAKANSRYPVPIILGPHQSSDIETISADLSHNEEQRRTAARGKFLHFWGLITYRDIFNRKRWTEFCFIGRTGTNRFHITGENNKGN